MLEGATPVTCGPGCRPSHLALEAQLGLVLLLREHLVVLVDDGHGEEDTRAAADGAEEVGHHGQRTNAHATEGSGSGDVPGHTKSHKTSDTQHAVLRKDRAAARLADSSGSDSCLH